MTNGTQTLYGYVQGPGYGNSNDWRSAGKKNSREEENYYDISEYSTSSNPMRAPRPSPPPHRSAAAAAHATHAAVRHSPSGHSHLGGYQQQQAAPLGRNGSAGSSQNGGYYSSNSSCAVGPTTSYHQPGTSARRQSISSRAPSVEDEDDGFYDNIGIYGSMSDDRRYSRGSELGDTVSMSSARLPPSTKPTRIGSFLSKIGARSNGASLVRSPGTAASLVSLNKVAMEPPIQQRGSLVKSNSLSNDPWRKEVIEGSQGKRGNSTGLGARLKNSLFGSKKRLN
ncbi:hypothetical protein PFISCL1PPCAC_20392 [Pristionchus fissidentatus]|uniref:Uncharacterized protein n=1 Tax=Pristionchus fissidentatus TaxID=1538716 RepID=A0AAV5WEN7_9BILA|nr:hypothetical protein PFISCL1PPCAC_20392 [Pristionchus fissidentatus]